MRPGPLRARRLLAGVLLTCTWVGLAACTPDAGTAAEPASVATGAEPSSAPSADSEPVPAAPVGTPARSTRVRFVPQQVVLPGGASAEVVPAATVDGELKVPEEVKHVGWWDGSAYAGDPFGNTVIAGHVDSATEGLGFFARLDGMRTGETVTLHGSGHTQTYRITKVQTIKKGALADGSQAFDQTGDHHLVLITCTGAYRKDRGGYDSNLVLTGVPEGLAR